VSAREPSTEAGRSLHGGHCRYPATCDYLAAILAIEAEAHAAGLAEGRIEREELARATGGVDAMTRALKP
jgi:hypothetical protein